MKNILKIIIFCIPFYFMLYINYYIDSYACCRMTYDRIASKMVSGYDVRILTDYNERNLCLSLIRKQAEIPQVIVIGSSRGGLFNATCLERFDKCLNLCMSGANLEDYKGVIGTLEYYKKLPEYVILEINGSLFNKYEDTRYKEMENSINYYTDMVNNRKTHYREKQLSFDITKLFSPSYFKYNLQQFDNDKRFDVIFEKDALTGKHYDGSFTPTNENLDNMEFVIENTNTVIENGSVYGLGKVEISEEKKRDFEQMVNFLQDKEVKVIFYIPPYSRPIYEYMESQEKYDSVLATEDYILEYAHGKEIPVYGSFNPSYCDLELEDLYDAYHIRRKAIMKTFYLREENYDN